MQLVDLGMPFGYGEQAPFLGRKISAIRLATAPDDDSAAAAATRPARLDATRFVRLGRAAESILASLDGGIELAGGTAGHVYLGSRIIRGWAIELVLARRARPVPRRRDRPLRPQPAQAAAAAAGPGGRSGRGSASGSGSGCSSALGALAGVFPARLGDPAAARTAPRSPTGPSPGLLVLGLLAALGWLRARRVLVPVAPAAR